jgi:HEPN domain-containing protein
MDADLKSALEEGDYSMVVRRAQEAVELALKGGLSELGVEYPKVHDVGGLFGEVASSRLVVEAEVLDRISRISTRLSEERAPAFYGEKLYGRAEATEAQFDADFVVKAVADLLRGTRKQDGSPDPA